MWVLGEDFSFLYANETYALMDVIIDSVEHQSSLFKFKYSTVKQYVDAAKSEMKEKNVKLQTYENDFFPVYETWKDVHWTGYYSSRPNFKKFIRELGSVAYESASLYALDMFKSIST